MDMEITPDCPECHGTGRVPFAPGEVDERPCGSCLRRYDEHHSATCAPRFRRLHVDLAAPRMGPYVVLVDRSTGERFLVDDAGTLAAAVAHHGEVDRYASLRGPHPTTTPTRGRGHPGGPWHPLETPLVGVKPETIPAPALRKRGVGPSGGVRSVVAPPLPSPSPFDTPVPVVSKPRKP